MKKLKAKTKYSTPKLLIKDRVVLLRRNWFSDDIKLLAAETVF